MAKKSPRVEIKPDLAKVWLDGNIAGEADLYEYPTVTLDGGLELTVEDLEAIAKELKKYG